MSDLRFPSQSRIAWGVVGILLGLMIAYVLYAYIGAFVFALFIYYAVRPAYRRLNAHIAHPNAAATATILLIVVPLLAILGYTLLIAIHEARQFLQTLTPTQSSRLMRSSLDVLHISLGSGSPRALLTHPWRIFDINIVTLLQRYREQLLGIVNFVFNLFFHLFILLIVTFYLLRDDHKIAEWMHTTLGGGEGVNEYMRAVDRDLESLYFGNLVNVVIIALIAIGTYHAFNVLPPSGTPIPYPTLLGILTGLASLVPVIGIKLVYFPLTLFVFIEALRQPSTPLWFPVVFFGIALVIVDTIPDFIIRTYVSARRLHFGLVLLSYALGALVFGWYGLFFGPIVLVLFLHFARTVFPYVVHGE